MHSIKWLKPITSAFIKPLSKSVCITPAAFGAEYPSLIVQAWTIKDGYSAPNAAGVIHTDFERGFIKAEVIGFNHFIECNGEIGAKEKGKLRLEGKDYIVKDGDVIHFKFNV